MEPQTELVFTTTLACFFFNKGRKYLVTRKGPTTLVCRTVAKSVPDLQQVSRVRIDCAQHQTPSAVEGPGNLGAQT